MKRFLFFIFIVIAPALYFNGCIPSKPTEEVEILPSERLINKLEANRRRIKTFEGTGTISLKSDQLNNSATFKIVVSKPDSISLTIMGPFGIELAQAYVTKNNFAFYDAMQNTVYEGQPSDDILKEIFKINLSFNDLMDAFVGSVNLTDKLYLPPNGYEVVYDQYILKYMDNQTNLQTKYVVDVRELSIDEYELSNGEGNLLEGKYSKFSVLEGVAVPYNIQIKNLRDNQLLQIDYRNMRANKKDIYINFDVPDDATVIKW